MLIRHRSDIAPSEITPRSVYLRRREFLAGAAAAGLIAGLSPAVLSSRANAAPMKGAPSPLSTTGETLTPLKDIISYNNFYEFGTDKGDPAKNAHTLKTSPWTVKVDGLVNKGADYNLEDLIRDIALEERIYRMRCVEGWSMVIPWVGIPLASVLNRVEPQGSARFVAFETLVRPAEMVGQRGYLQALPWPYKEGLRLDEAMNPLTILAVGLYGETLPNQNGAPIRLVVPWKYGFKSIKSIVRVRFTAEQPLNTWQQTARQEYGFYANVNPTVNHPRWSQATERRLGELRPRNTLMFNGYADQVAHLYSGMNLRQNF
jgi:sulfoxide reductase catalytic subunit YedY